MPTLALYVGSPPAPNLVRFLSGLATVADDDFTLELVGRSLDASTLPDRYECHDTGGPAATRGLDEIRRAYGDLVEYLDRTESRPDAIWQITTPQFHAVPALIAARRAGVPVAARLPGQKFSEFRSAGGPLTGAKTFVLNNVQLQLLRFTDATVVLSEHNARTLAAYGFDDGTIRTLLPLLDTEEFAPPTAAERRRLQSELGFEPDLTNVLYVGRLSRLKGMESVASAVEALDATEYRMHVVGDGPFADRFRTTEGIVVHGRVSPSAVHEYYKAADALLHPSYTEEEGISWTMLEAAATGLPVIARDVENASDIASFVFETDAELVEYLRDPDRWRSATYPTAWSIRELEPAYNSFLGELTGRT